MKLEDIQSIITQRLTDDPILTTVPTLIEDGQTDNDPAAAEGLRQKGLVITIQRPQQAHPVKAGPIAQEEVLVPITLQEIPRRNRDSDIGTGETPEQILSRIKEMLLGYVPPAGGHPFALASPSTLFLGNEKGAEEWLLNINAITITRGRR